MTILHSLFLLVKENRDRERTREREREEHVSMRESCLKIVTK